MLHHNNITLISLAVSLHWLLAGLHSATQNPPWWSGAQDPSGTYKQILIIIVSEKARDLTSK